MTTQPPVPSLLQRRILVVEDEYMIATEVADALDLAGATVLGPVPRLDEAHRILATGGAIDAALVDVNLGGEVVWPLVDALLALDIPLLLATGYDGDAIPAPYAVIPRHGKPASGDDLIRSLVRVLEPAPTT